MKTVFTSLFCICTIQIFLGQTIGTAKTIKIGDEYQGGIVFFIDDTGEHGLIAAPNDQTTEKVWWGPNSITMALSPTDGQSNTKKIVEYFQAEPLKMPTAAERCDNLSFGGHSDWYLPAIEELKKCIMNDILLATFLLEIIAVHQSKINIMRIPFILDLLSELNFFTTRKTKIILSGVSENFNNSFSDSTHTRFFETYEGVLI